MQTQGERLFARQARVYRLLMTCDRDALCTGFKYYRRGFFTILGTHYTLSQLRDLPSYSRYSIEEFTTVQEDFEHFLNYNARYNLCDDIDTKGAPVSFDRYVEHIASQRVILL